MEVVNFGILKHPINWITVIIMVLIAAMAFHLAMRFWQNSA